MVTGRQWNLGFRRRGEIIRVTLRGSAANVLLVDSANLSNFKAGRRTTYIGGLVKTSPYDMAVPHAGNWHVVVTMTGLRGNTNASVQILPGALPPARPSLGSQLGTIRQAADDYIADVDVEDGEPSQAKPYDVFICHAFDDKEEIVRDLAHALRAQDLTVWFDEFELKIGDNLRRKIDSGLNQSRFGVVVLSPAFFAKGWRQYELDGLVTLEVSGDRQIILPIWHNVGQAEVMKYSPSLAAKLARSTAENSIEQIAIEIASVARA